MDKVVNRWIRIIFYGVLLIVVLSILAQISDLVQLLIISALLAYVLDPVVSRMEGRGMSRTVATVLLFMVSGFMASVFAVFSMPVISSEFVDMREGFDPEKTRLLLAKIDTFIRNELSFLGLQDLSLTGSMAQTFIDYGKALFQNLRSVVSVFSSLIITPFVVFFLLKDGRQIKKGLISLVPNRYFEFFLNLIYKMDQQLGNYLRGQFLDAFIIGVLSTIALLLLDVKYALLIGTFAGFANLIPYIGPLCGAAVAVLVSLLETGDLLQVVYIALAFGIVQLIDNVFVQPNVVAKTVNLSPLVVLFVVIIGGRFFGVLGMLLSVPVTGILKVLFQEWQQTSQQYHLRYTPEASAAGQLVAARAGQQDQSDIHYIGTRRAGSN